MLALLLAVVIGASEPPPPPPVPAKSEPRSEPSETHEQRPQKKRERPLRSGKAMIITGGVILGGALVGRAVVTGLTASDVPDCRRKEAAGELDDLECDLSGVALVGLATIVPAALGAGLLAGGMAMKGRWDATHDLRAGGSAVRDMRRRAILGWSLFGAGVTVYGATRFGSFACATYECIVGVWETGFWAGAALVVPGVVIAPHATAYQRTRRRHAALRLVPTFAITARASMFGIAGRF